MNEVKTENSKIESGRADFALAEVKKVIKTSRKDNYKSYAKKFPSMIQSNGLAAALAFAYENRQSKKKDVLERKAWFDIYDNVGNYLVSLKYIKSISPDSSLLEYVCSLETAQYRIVTKEVLSLFNWIRRFASGLIEGDENNAR